LLHFANEKFSTKLVRFTSIIKILNYTGSLRFDNKTFILSKTSFVFVSISMPLLLTTVACIHAVAEILTVVPAVTSNPFVDSITAIVGILLLLVYIQIHYGAQEFYLDHRRITLSYRCSPLSLGG